MFGSATWGMHATLATPNNFHWHAEALSFTYQFCYNSQVLLTLCKNMDVVGTLNDFES